MGIHLRVLNESFLMSTNMRGLIKMVFKNSYICTFWIKVASVLQGLLEKIKVISHTENFIMVNMIECLIIT